MTETIHRIRALELGETLNFDEGYTCGPDYCRIGLWEMLHGNRSAIRYDEPVIDSDVRRCGSPKIAFEEIGELLLGGGFRARPRTCNFSQRGESVFCSFL